MKKTKLIMPIIGISALGTSLVPLTTLTSCSKGFSVELTSNNKEKDIYSNTTVSYYEFKQNITENVTKTKVKIINLKINGSEAATVSGLTKITADSAGNIRVALNVATIYSHYNKPETIEFDLLFTNKANNQTYTVSGFKMNADQSTKVSYPFSLEGTVITGFTDETKDYSADKFAEAYEDIFIPVSWPQQNKKFIQGQSGTYYKMVIPNTFTGIKDNAFYNTDDGSLMPDMIVELDFAPDSKIGSIGKEAFAGSYLSYVNLPSSLNKTGLGEYCFAGITNLISIKFAPDNNEEITIPNGFAVGASLRYVKIPTYVTQIGTGTEEEQADDPVFTTENGLILDFSEWSNAMVQNNLTFGYRFLSSCSCNVITNSTDTNILTQLNSKFKVAECAEQSEPIATYDMALDASSSVATIESFQTSSKFDEFVTKTKEISNNFFGNENMYRFELPNYFIPQNSRTLTPTTTVSSLCMTQWLKFVCCAGSIVMPNELIGMEAGQFSNNSIMWEIALPKTIKSLAADLFCDSSLTSIVFDGTSTEWANIKKVTESGSEWNAGCGDIKVYCTDQTVDVPAIE